MWRFDFWCSCSYLYNLVIFSLCSKLKGGGRDVGKKKVYGGRMSLISVSTSSLVSGISRGLKDTGKVYFQHSQRIFEYLEDMV